MLRRFVLTAIVASLLAAAGVRAAQTAVPTTLKVGGDVTTPLTLTLADVKAMPRTRVEINQDGRVVTFEGVLVGEILKRAGAPVRGDLHGTALTTYVLASAADGYQILFSLAELDPELTKNDIIVADSVDGKPLVAGQGTFRIVTPKDTRASRGIRLLDRLDVVRLKK